MKLDSLRKLYVDQLKDIYSAEKQMLKALPKMEKAATNPQLAAAFREHQAQTQQQIERIEQLFSDLEFSPTGEHCKGMEGLIEEGQELIKEKDATPEVLDAGLIAAAQKAEHYEIAAYGSIRSYAELLGLDDAVQIIQTSLDEEKETDQKLNQLAESVINLQAQQA